MVLYEIPQFYCRSYPGRPFPRRPSRVVDDLDLLMSFPGVHPRCHPGHHCNPKRMDKATRRHSMEVPEMFWEMMQPLYSQCHPKNEKEKDGQAETGNKETKVVGEENTSKEESEKFEEEKRKGPKREFWHDLPRSHPFHQIVRPWLDALAADRDAKSEQEKEGAEEIKKEPKSDQEPTTDVDEFLRHMMHPWFHAYLTDHGRSKETTGKEEEGTTSEVTPPKQEQLATEKKEAEPMLKAEAEKDKNAQTQKENEGFSASLDVSNFEPEQIKVTLNGGLLTVEAKQEQEDEQGYKSQQFMRRVQIPDNVDVEQIKSTFKEGKLAIEAPFKQSKGNKETTVPIRMEGKEEETDDYCCQI